MTTRARMRGYSLEIEDPRSGAISTERYISLAAAVTHAVKLIQDGYNIGIWSAASLEQRATDAVAANDDAWLDARSKRLTG